PARCQCRGQHICHWANVADGNAWVDISDRSAQLTNIVSNTADFRLNLRRAVNAVAQPRHTFFDNLSQRQVRVRPRVRFKIGLLNRPNYSDNFYRSRPSIVVVNHQALSDRGAVRKMILRQHAADDDNRRAITVVFLREVAAGEQWNPHRAKIIRSDHSVVGIWPVLGFCRRTVWSDERNIGNAFRSQWQDRAKPGVLFFGKGGDNGLEIFLKLK